MIEGKVGNKSLSWLSNPKGMSGEAQVKLADGRIEKVRWLRDSQGIWIETSKGFSGFDVRKTLNDQGSAEYELLKRRSAELIHSVSFLKTGEGDSNDSNKVKKAVRVKSQMPGKILRVLVSAGASVKKGDALMVMEAMKMENEIKALQDGVIKDVKVTEGQAVETGAELLTFA